LHPEGIKRIPAWRKLFDVGGGNGYISQALKKSGIDTVLVEQAKLVWRMPRPGEYIPSSIQPSRMQVLSDM